jgi:hypothetical protein
MTFMNGRHFFIGTLMSVVILLVSGRHPYNPKIVLNILIKEASMLHVPGIVSVSISLSLFVKR